LFINKLANTYTKNIYTAGKPYHKAAEQSNPATEIRKASGDLFDDGIAGFDNSEVQFHMKPGAEVGAHVEESSDELVVEHGDPRAVLLLQAVHPCTRFVFGRVGTDPHPQHHRSEDNSKV
jgi:hypothetical protein